MSEMNDIIKNGQLMPADLTARSAINTTTWTWTLHQEQAPVL